MQIVQLKCYYYNDAHQHPELHHMELRLGRRAVACRSTMAAEPFRRICLCHIISPYYFTVLFIATTVTLQLRADPVDVEARL